ncbi:hypothetical protein [Pseudomonas syringae]|uniref:hypothetical protein n=1 Tax=Pseudomonas syringae TaxID=317 RepID=UPI0006E545C9|nr:hypothetical protein [Pseudomonas syringae]KPY45364.1 hypothetical protein ALO48_03170 [Pseudomonas syringae pv. rhaphiolepidis]KWS45743.1 hypothetical protein AL060_12315 [Pseudomonas syringae pv. rhaphiolepidis]
MREYERYQLDSIISEYTSQGYTVEIGAHLAATNSQFDAIATRGDDDRMVLIEIVNPDLTDRQIAARRRAIENAASQFPRALVDFRYIDQRQSAFQEFNKRDDNFRHLQFRQFLNARLPVFNKKPEHAARQLLSLWGSYTSLLRGFGRFCGHSQNETASILELYNSFLQHGILVPAERTDDEVSDDLFLVHEVMIAATQGAIVDIHYVKQLRGHYQALRKQARRHSKKGWVKEAIRW